MLYRLGMILVIVGAMAADSPSVLAPISVIALGLGIMYIGRRFENGKTEQD